MSDSKKSGYAIRTDILGMAIGILESRNDQMRENAHRIDDKTIISPYTSEEVIAEAEKLYAFVENGSSSGNLKTRVVIKS